MHSSLIRLGIGDSFYSGEGNARQLGTKGTLDGT
jgi:hypothetical protein